MAMITKSIPLLSGDNYLQWRERMKALLMTRKLWEAVVGFKNDDEELIKDPEQFDSIQRQKDEDAQIIILQGVDDEFVGDIKNEPTAQRRWKALEVLHCDYSSVDISTLFGELFAMKKTDAVTIRQYLSQAEGLMDKIVEAGVKLPDDVKAALLLPGLPEKKYGALKTQFRVEDKTLSYLNVKARLIKFGRQDEMIKVKVQEEDVADAHKVSVKLQKGKSSNNNKGSDLYKGSDSYNSRSGVSNKFSKTIRCYKCGESGHGLRECTNRVKCFKCDKFGHISTDCQEKRTERKDDRASGSMVTASMQETANRAAAMVVSSKKRFGKFLDSCASHHMCPHKEWFVEIKESRIKAVNQGDESELPVEGEGRVVIPMASGWTITFEGVLFVPNLGSTLISVGQLTKKGYRLAFAGDEAAVLSKDGKEIMFKALSIGTIYVIQTLDNGVANVVSGPSCGIINKVENESEL